MEKKFEKVRGIADGYPIPSPLLRDPAVVSMDTALITDICILVSAAAIAGSLVGFLNLPPSIGFILAGSAVGPSGLYLVRRLDEVEAFGQFGTIFPLFAIGMQFSLRKASKSITFSVASLLAILFVYVPLLATLAYACGLVSTVTEAAFIALSTALSSPGNAVHCLSSGQLVLTSIGELSLGALAAQVVLLGSLLTSSEVSSYDTLDTYHIMSFLLELGQSMALFGFIGAITYCLAAFVIPRIRFQASNQSGELFLLSIISICLAFGSATDLLGLSMEMGALCAGLLVSKSSQVDAMFPVVEPIAHLFGAVFFASIGTVINPAFLASNALWVFTALGMCLTLKSLVFIGLGRLFRFSWAKATTIALSMSSVAEFSLIIAAKAHATGLLTRQVYLTWISMSILSLAASTGLFHLLLTTTAAHRMPLHVPMPAAEESSPHMPIVRNRTPSDPQQVVIETPPRSPPQAASEHTRNPNVYHED